MTDREVGIRLTADGRGLVGEVRRSGHALRDMAGGAERSGSRMRRAFAGVAGVLGRLRRQIFSLQGLLVGSGVSYGLGVILRATSRQEQAIARVEARLRGLAGETTLTSAALQKIAADLQDVTTFGDESVLETQALLLTFRSLGNIGAEEMRRVTEVVLDMATAMGVDASSAARQLALAVENPRDGLTQLRRAGTTFTDAQREMIIGLVDAGRKAEALAAILAVIEGQVGGTARALRDTLGGAFSALGNAAGDLLEGADATGQLRQSVESLVDFLRDPQTMAYIQEFLRLLIEGLGLAAEAAAWFGSVSRSMFPGDATIQNLHDLVLARRVGGLQAAEALGNRQLRGQANVAAEDLIGLSPQEIDAQISFLIVELYNEGRKLPYSLVKGIRDSGANIPAALLAKVTGYDAPLKPYETIEVGLPPFVMDVELRRALAAADGLQIAPSPEEILRAHTMAARIAQEVRDRATAEAAALALVADAQAAQAGEAATARLAVTREFEEHAAQLRALGGEYEAMIPVLAEWRDAQLAALREPTLLMEAQAATLGSARDAWLEWAETGELSIDRIGAALRRLAADAVWQRVLRPGFDALLDIGASTIAGIIGGGGVPLPAPPKPVLDGSGRGVSVSLRNQSPAPLAVQSATARTEGGQLIVDATVGDLASGGKLDRAIRSRYGLSPVAA